MRCPEPRLPCALDDRYLLTAHLGHGGGGVVCAAIDAVTQQRCAVKLPHEADPVGEHRLLLEFQFLREVRGADTDEIRDCAPGELRIHTTADGRLFLVMERLVGGDLEARLQVHPVLPIGEALELVETVARVIAWAHSRGFCHRDIKPSNVFVVRRGRRRRVVLLDPGLARCDGVKLTGAWEVAGTPGVMPREVARGERGDRAADVYQLGALLLRCATGRDPIEGVDPHAIVVATARATEPPPLDAMALALLGGHRRSSPDGGTARMRPADAEALPVMRAMREALSHDAASRPRADAFADAVADTLAALRR